MKQPASQTRILPYLIILGAFVAVTVFASNFVQTRNNDALRDYAREQANRVCIQQVTDRTASRVRSKIVRSTAFDLAQLAQSASDAWESLADAPGTTPAQRRVILDTSRIYQGIATRAEQNARLIEVLPPIRCD